MGFQNFSIWRGRLPHWRADDVRYYVTFRHRRALEQRERLLLLDALRKPDGRKWDLIIACVTPEKSELILTAREAARGDAIEISDVVEGAKRRTGKAIIKRTEERFAPFYEESYDRIIRDEAEMEERFNMILEEPVSLGLVEEPEEYDGLWVADAPQ